MENIHTFGEERYQSADTLEEPNGITLIITWIAILASLLPNIIIVVLLSAIRLLRAVYRLLWPKPLKDLRGQVAVVTGGSNGIGREICLELARTGCSIAILDVDIIGAEKTCNDIGKLGIRAIPYKVDIGKYDEVAKVKKQIDEDFGAVDILVNNAALLPRVSLREGTPEDIERIVSVNITSHFWTIRVFIEDMIARRSGYIVALSSMISYYPSSRAIAYGASKYAIKGLMDSLNQEIRHENLGIKTLTVFPHIINTRKEVMDMLRSNLSTQSLERVGAKSPYDVAVATVRAIRSNARNISVPWFYLGLGKVFQALPFDLQQIIVEVVMPKLRRASDDSGP